ncbi:MAG: PadR family transcriptional regulator [Planctomycetota bacterium]|jgi:DNA-binding PadR family transcriptional regulator
MAKRSDLELVVLGVVWKMGPCTPYAIRREFLTSPTPHFSGSAGTIYPLVRRLERDGLLSSEAAQQGRRRSRLYRTTSTGTAALKRWLRPPVPLKDIAGTYDPIRVRIYFLKASPPAQRRALLDEVLAEMKRRIPVLEADERRYVESGDEFSRLASRGIRRMLEAKMDWIREVRRALISRGLGGAH